MAPKKKAQKMALNEFFADTTSGDWADEMDNLPTAPAPKDPNAGPQRGEAGYLDSMPDRAARAGGFGGPPREELPIPSQPPYTAHVGNMAFETDEEAVKEFFSAQQPLTARIMKDPQGANKGYGYVEFPTADALRGALALGGSNLGGRNIRVSVAEPPSSRPGREFTPSAADEASQWRRSGPLPARDPPPSARRQGSYNDAGAAGGDRDWSSARGARFTPSVPPTPSGLRRDSSGPGREREFREPREPSQADEAGQWRSARPMADLSQASAQGPRDRFGSGQSSPSLADTENTWSRGTKLRTPAQEPASSGAPSPAEERGDWRSSRATSAVPSTDGDNSPRQAPAPLERRKLNLAPRSAAPASPTTATSANSNDSIFGAAKPIDTAAKEQAAAEKLKVRDEERRKAREEAAKKEEEANRKVLEDRAKSIRDAQAAAMAEVTGQKAPTRPQADRGYSGQGGQGKRRGERKVGEDGFEIAKGAKAAPAVENKPAATRKESTTRTGFSFAAAAGSVGFAAAEEEEEKGDNEVAEVTNGVKEVAV